MTYGMDGITSGDAGKIAVTLSCGFNVLMSILSFTDPAGVIHSEHGGGWWNLLQGIHKNNNSAGGEEREDPRAFIYPRIWGTFLIYQLIVRMNWVLTLETAPALYRCVLMSYILPFVQYSSECFVYQTLPPYDVGMVLLFNLPWFVLIFNYTKYTQEQGGDSSSSSVKKNNKKDE
mmetsp:Transcript_1909/g.5245  ORF Transcript_1909/g.5245 Transcript_1909/m.5245 type:complete len:175 (-) Transcript_1909:404-928(-)|eukprot:CAMPEP_0168740380 /NCGR_PEP_ID=MMETSP0724-20121128/11953_1 /TAXON_ID=265536 /ORGANISM="Amphiprora sp., Strain CCMP467" /LENGTH=174 /DNA_ID=CAMNT_0008787821 /DNA_START=42 /DNA_END=566 /DNA_ORIENTATION=+